MIPIANLGFHAFMAQCCYVLNPLVLSTSVKLGGLGLNPYEIGLILGTWGGELADVFWLNGHNA